MSGEVALADAGSSGLLEDRVDLLSREELGDYAQADVVGDAAARG